MDNEWNDVPVNEEEVNDTPAVDEPTDTEPEEEQRDRTELDDELIDTDSIDTPPLPEPNEDGVVVAQTSENGPPTSAITDALDEPTATPPTSSGPWPKKVPEGKQVNGFTGELEDAPPNDVSASPLEQRLVAMGSTAYREGDKGGLGDQFTTTQNFGTHAEKQITDEGVVPSSGVTEPVRDEHTGPRADEVIQEQVQGPDIDPASLHAPEDGDVSVQPTGDD
jgi:hypothetical protein